MGLSSPSSLAITLSLIILCLYVFSRLEAVLVWLSVSDSLESLRNDL